MARDGGWNECLKVSLVLRLLAKSGFILLHGKKGLEDLSDCQCQPARIAGVQPAIPWILGSLDPSASRSSHQGRLNGLVLAEDGWEDGAVRLAGGRGVDTTKIRKHKPTMVYYCPKCINCIEKKN
jgi:hypothetical protein